MVIKPIFFVIWIWLFHNFDPFTGSRKWHLVIYKLQTYCRKQNQQQADVRCSCLTKIGVCYFLNFLVSQNYSLIQERNDAKNQPSNKTVVIHALWKFAHNKTVNLFFLYIFFLTIWVDVGKHPYNSMVSTVL